MLGKASSMSVVLVYTTPLTVNCSLEKPLLACEGRCHIYIR